MQYELRIYVCAPGRLPDLLNRFENLVLSIWKELGINPVGFWTTASERPDGRRDELVYLLRWNNDEERNAKMDAFLADPRWIEGRDKSEVNGKLVESLSTKLLSPTSFSPRK
jgi:NIPSNAP